MTAPVPAGVTVISRTAARRLITAVAASELRVPARRVDVRLTDDRARWRIEVVAGGLHEDERSVLSAADGVRDRILRDIPQLAGAAVGRVTVRIASIEEERSRVA